MTAETIVKHASEEEHVHGEHCNHHHVEEHEEHVDVDVEGQDDSEDEDEDVAVDNMNRGEKKARKLVTKAGLTLVPGIERVAIKRGRMIFAIPHPMVFEASNDCYVVFGEAKVEDSALQAQAMAAQRLANAARASAPSAAANEDEEEEEEEQEDAAEQEEQEDAEGVDEKDIKIVMDQANVSRSAAIAALKANDNDIVNTIMDLSS